MIICTQKRICVHIEIQNRKNYLTSPETGRSVKATFDEIYCMFT